jgi:hypothetical protein
MNPGGGGGGSSKESIVASGIFSFKIGIVSSTRSKASLYSNPINSLIAEQDSEL